MTVLTRARRWIGSTPHWVAFVVLSAVLIVAAITSAAVGQLGVGTTDVIGALLRGIGIDNGWAPEDELVYQALWQIRFPRVAMSIFVGTALALGGAAMQAIFGNPLAEPGVVGVSSGAALGAAAVIVTGASVGVVGTASAAFVGGVLTTVLVYTMARSQGRTEVVTLLLTGIAIQAFAAAGLAFAVFSSDTSSREQIVFWQLGSLNGARWPEVALVAGITVTGLACLLTWSRQFDLLALGERTAGHLGVRVERLRIMAIIVIAVLTAGAVAFAGVIAFVGLIVPHLMRLLLGPSHRGLLVASALGGAVLLCLADIAARTLITGADLPIGMLTSLIGGPFFFYLLRRTRRSQGGWA